MRASCGLPMGWRWADNGVYTSPERWLWLGVHGVRDGSEGMILDIQPRRQTGMVVLSALIVGLAVCPAIENRESTDSHRGTTRSIPAMPAPATLPNAVLAQALPPPSPCGGEEKAATP